MNPEEALISSIAWDSLIEEFFIIGINSVDQAKSFSFYFSLNLFFPDFFKPNSSYRGEVLLSLPTTWAENSNIVDALYAYEFRIENKQLPNFSFSSSFTGLNPSDPKCGVPYYLHCFVVYEDITDLMKSAKMNMIKESIKFSSNLESNLLLEPLYLEMTNFFYPMTLVIKSRRMFDGVFLEVLEALIEVLYSEGKIFDDECDSKFYKMVKFASNLFFLVNNLKRPSPNSVLQYTLSPYFY